MKELTLAEMQEVNGGGGIGGGVRDDIASPILFGEAADQTTELTPGKASPILF